MTPINRRLLYIFRGSLLRLRITWAGQMLTRSIGYHIDKTDSKGRPKWDGSRCRQNTTHGPDKVAASIINKELDKVEAAIEKAFADFERLDVTPTATELKAVLDGGKASQKGFFELFDEFLDEGERYSFWSKSTIKKLRTQKKLLQKFNPKLTFEALTEATLRDYVHYQTKNCVSSDEDISNYTNTTIRKNINLLKWFLRWATKKGYNDNLAYATFKPSLKVPEKEVIFLTWDELMRLYEYDYSDSPDKAAVRDCFCLCCFTSLRYSDLANLKKSDIKEDSIEVVTVKTHDRITIDLNDYSRAILNRYKDTEGEKAMPVISNQKMNDKLKLIAEDCKIDTPQTVVTYCGAERIERTVPKHKLISTHAGRRTFICNALALGVAPNIVMQWTGHSDYNAMKPYIAVADETRKSSMNVFNMPAKEGEKRE